MQLGRGLLHAVRLSGLVNHRLALELHGADVVSLCLQRHELAQRVLGVSPPGSGLGARGGGLAELCAGLVGQHSAGLRDAQGVAGCFVHVGGQQGQPRSLDSMEFTRTFLAREFLGGGEVVRLHACGAPLGRGEEDLVLGAGLAEEEAAQPAVGGRVQQAEGRVAGVTAVAAVQGHHAGTRRSMEEVREVGVRRLLLGHANRHLRDQVIEVVLPLLLLLDGGEEHAEGLLRGVNLQGVGHSRHIRATKNVIDGQFAVQLELVRQQGAISVRKAVVEEEEGEGFV